MKRPNKDRPIAVDLFSGAGGMSLGFEQAGFDVLAAVEIDPIHAAVHRFNFPECTVIPKSVTELSGQEIRNLANLGNRPVSVVFGGAPCQGFSMIGQRALEDPRNCLVRDFVRLVIELEPDFFVFENVKGLTLGRHVSFLMELIVAFKGAGYSVRIPWQVLDAAEYGVPQHRERLFLLGAKIGGKLPNYPESVNFPGDSKQSFLNIPRGPTVSDALSDLPDPSAFPELVESDSVLVPKWRKPTQYASTLRCEREEDWFFGYRRRFDPKILTSSMTTEHTDISRERFASSTPGTVEPISRFFKLDPKGLSNTLRAGTDSARGAFTSPRPIHYSSPRCVTVREMARLHGYPDWFRFHRTKWHGARQIGNSVPPPLARAIAGVVIDAIGVSVCPPERILTLGNEDLLRFDMTEASSFWGIQSPIGRRDRKSGQKKRRQGEIENFKAESAGARNG